MTSSTTFEDTLKSAEAGDPEAQYTLGRMYRGGDGVPRDNGEALRWFRKAAEQGHPDAQYSLAEMYSNGAGVGEDKTQAFFWYLKAA
ncbi:MAG: sel1 repeat family protein, partial [Methylobacteriaceae bacterium]|nr:sel1 repeat family protein [Methylobacteriaceae bacterium]